jgi:mono/diheme cytochrome c family protein
MQKDITRSLVVVLTVTLLPCFALAEGSVDKGKALFVQQCASCHGAGGKGDAPAAAALNPKPRNLTDKAYMATLNDQHLVDVIKKGGPAVGKSPLMPAMGAALKDGDIQDVIAFIRSLTK